MLMDILMEALMSMDDESLDYVLESCDAEELEIISDAMEARFEDGPTIVTDKKAMKDAISERYGNKIMNEHGNAGPNKQDVEIAKRLYDPNNKGHKSTKRLLLAQIQNKDKKNFAERVRKRNKAADEYFKFQEANIHNPAARYELDKRSNDLQCYNNRGVYLYNTRRAIRSDRNKLRLTPRSDEFINRF